MFGNISMTVDSGIHNLSVYTCYMANVLWILDDTLTHIRSHPPERELSKHLPRAREFSQYAGEICPTHPESLGVSFTGLAAPLLFGVLGGPLSLEARRDTFNS